MRGFLQFLSNYSGFLLFLLLEGLCFYLIVRFNDTQQRIATSSANALIGFVYKRTDDVTNYFGLEKQVNDLMEENAALRAQLFELTKYVETDSLFQDSVTVEEMAVFLRDSLRVDTARYNYSFIPAKVINNSIVAEDNMLTLDRGRRDGIEPGLGVVSSDGIVGIVRNVSERYATVMSVLHRDARISASVKNKGFFGTLQWEGNNARYMYLNAVPKHEPIAINDTVQTSGYSTIFPRGIMIGTVDTFYTASGDTFYTIRVKLNNELGKLQKAYVVKFEQKAEINALEQQLSQ
jgi:rod shape-determining protein MreC